MGRKKKDQDIYWTEEHELLYIELSKDMNNQKTIKKLMPPIRKMSKIILHKYFDNYVNESDKQICILEAITKVVLVAHRFDSTKGTRAYSFAQTVIKNFYSSKFLRKRLDEKMFEDALSNNNTHNEDGEYLQIEDNFNYVDYQKEFEIMTPIEQIIISLKKKRLGFIKQREQFQKELLTNKRMKLKLTEVAKHIQIVDIMIQVLQTKEFSTVERFFLDVHSYTNVTEEALILIFRRMGFDFEDFNLYGLYYLAKDKLGGDYKSYAPNPDYLFIDNYIPGNDLERNRISNRKKSLRLKGIDI